MINIYNKYGTLRLAVVVTSSDIYHKELQTSEYVQLDFKLTQLVRLKRGDYIDTEFGRFYITDVNSPQYDPATGSYKYEQMFHAHWEFWRKRILYYSRQQGREKAWKMTQTAAYFMQIVVENLTQAGFGTFTYEVDASLTEMKLVEFDSTDIIEALNKIAETFETEWWIENRTIHLCRCEYGTPLELSVGEALSKIERNQSQDTVYVTRLVAFGGSRNIPQSYRNSEDSDLVREGLVEKRLKLPVGTPYIDAWEDMQFEDIEEGIIVLDDIYPRRVGTVGSISTKQYTDRIDNEDGTVTERRWNAYRFTDSGIIFSKDYVLEGQELRIVFQTGKLAGMDFAVKFNPDAISSESDPRAQVFEIVRSDDYGVSLPSDSFHPEVGNEYILYGFDIRLVSDQYVSAAEQELKTAAEQWLAKNSEDKGVYDCTTNRIRVAGYTMGADGELHYNEADEIDLDIGQRVRLVDENYFDSGYKDSRIRMYEKHLDNKFNATYSVGDEGIYSQSSALEIQIESLTYQSNTYRTGGSGGSVYVIKRYDDTTPNDFNVFSALRSKSEFISKRYSDTATGDHYTFEGKVTAGTTENNNGNDALEVQGIGTYNGVSYFNKLARFNQGWLLPYDRIGQLKGILRLMAPDQDNTEVFNGQINGNGTAVLKGATVNGTTNLNGTTYIDPTTGNIISRGSGAEDFVDGFEGYGMKLWKDGNINKWSLTLDTLTVRQTMKIYELLIQKIRSVGGTLAITAANGKIKEVEETGDYYAITFEDGCEFDTHDVLRCQKWNNGGTLKSYRAEVVNVQDDKAYVRKSDFTSYIPEVGDDCVQWGNTSVASRQNIIYITVTDGYPHISMLTGVTLESSGTLAVLLGNMDGISGSQAWWGGNTPGGWGLYSDNVFLRGDLVLANTSETVSHKFAVISDRFESEYSAMRAVTSGDSIIANHNFTDDWDYWHAIGAQELLSDGSELLSDGQTLLSGFGSADEHALLVEEDGLKMVRIKSLSGNTGIGQYVADMEDMEFSNPRVKRMAVLTLRCRTNSSATIAVTLTSTYQGTSCTLSSVGDGGLYGMHGTLTSDGKWHDLTIYGDYIGGNGELTITLTGTADITDIRLVAADGVEQLNTAITQNAEGIGLHAQRITQLSGRIDDTYEQVQTQEAQIADLDVRADGIEATVSRIHFSGNVITNIDKSDLVLDSEFATLFTQHVNDGNLQTGQQVADAISESLADYYDKDAIDDTVSGLVTNADFASMFNGYIDQQGNFTIAAQLATYVQFDPTTGEITGNVLISGDRIRLEGYTSINGGFNVDEDGNVMVMGVLNSGVLEIDTSNYDEYVSAPDGQSRRYLDALRLPATVVVSQTEDMELHLPCAYHDGTRSLPTGKTRFRTHHTEGSSGTDGWYINNLADLRSMIGKKIHFVNDSDNWQLGIAADLLVSASALEVDLSSTASLNDSITPSITKRWQCVPGSYQPLAIARHKFAELECKSGKWNDYECIYWEITYSGTTL